MSRDHGYCACKKCKTTEENMTRNDGKVTIKFVLGNTEHTVDGHVVSVSADDFSSGGYASYDVRVNGNHTMRPVHAEPHYELPPNRHSTKRGTIRCVCKCPQCLNPFTFTCICVCCGCEASK